MPARRSVTVKSGTELAALDEAVRGDKEPRLLDSGGKSIAAAVVSVEDLERLLLSGPPGKASQGLLPRPVPGTMSMTTN